MPPPVALCAPSFHEVRGQFGRALPPATCRRKPLPTGLTQIPSAIVPETWNWMLNPSYGDASTITIEGSFALALDPRLVR